MVKTKSKFPHLPDGSLDIPGWLATVQERYGLKDTSLIAKAYALAQQQTQGLTTFYGQPCIEQGMEIAETILKLKLDQETAAAGIISCISQPSPHFDDAIKKELGETVAKLTSSYQHIKWISSLRKTDQKDQPHLDKIRKMLLAMATDIRVVIIKLAERTSLLRGIKLIPHDERARYAQEVADLYAPLANRLGIGQIKLELEDLSLRYMEPETYAAIANFLSERRVQREDRVQQIITELKTKLLDTHLKAEVSGRAKHIFSIYAKAKRNKLRYQDIYDYNAFRILVSTIEDCYSALSMVHSLWPPVAAEFDDYISNPKPNGYRSIHTAVTDENGKHFEVQIRTHAMHEEAERGVAAHWIYKENKSSAVSDLDKITFLRQLLEWHKEIAEDNAAARTVNTAMTEDTVYVITPAGDILDLPVGATPLDFAYHIHSEIGHRCRGAKVNGRIAHLKTLLQTGDKVEILTTPEGGPSRDWMNPEFGYIKSPRARSKVAHWFKQQDLQQELAAGKHAKPVEKKAAAPMPAPLTKPAVDAPHTEIAGAASFLTRVAKCCKPIPGDAIIGYISQGKGLSIHKKTCNNIHHLANSKRFMDIDWDNKRIGTFNTDLKITASDREKLLHDISAFFVNEKINMLSFNSHFKRQQNKVSILVTIQIQDMAQLKNVISRLAKLPGIQDVFRIRK